MIKSFRDILIKVKLIFGCIFILVLPMIVRVLGILNTNDVVDRGDTRKQNMAHEQDNKNRRVAEDNATMAEELNASTGKISNVIYTIVSNV